MTITSAIKYLDGRINSGAIVGKDAAKIRELIGEVQRLRQAVLDFKGELLESHMRSRSPTTWGFVGRGFQGVPT